MKADFDVDTPIDHNYHVDPTEKMRRWESTLPEAYWDYRRKWEQNPVNHEVGDFPIHLDIEATSHCNLLCTMCPRTEMVEQGVFWDVGKFDFDKYKTLIDEGVKNGLCSVKYNYLGEPMMNKQLFDMIKYAKDAGVVDVMFNTNATALTEKNARKLIESGVDKLFFSFDSPYRERYNEIRIGADYDKVLNNIKRFHEIREEMGSIKPFTRISMVLMKDTEDQWEDFKALFDPIVDAVAYVDYMDHGIQKSDRNVVQFKQDKKSFCCPQLWQRMFVHPDGVVTPCCLDASRELVMGNVNENTASEIWKNEKYTEMRELHASGRINEIPTCARCPLAKY
ncbi:MAG: SPASM domain-containing protein [Gammaproteobacteria bacterium]|nr:SPASM domain-containing protein [Gammaproteobacteria bacterium]